MHLIDTHAHLFDESLVEDIRGVLRRATQVGVAQVINVATTADSSIRVQELSKQFAGVFATAGIHPNYAKDAKAEDLSIVERLISSERVVAIGETGLDRYWDDCPWEVQLQNFRAHIEMSLQSNVPLIIHTRDCYPEMIQVLKEHAGLGKLRGVMHSFAGDTDQAASLVELGMHISFAGMLTFKKSEELRQTASTIPLDRILVETDSPYLSPEPFRGKKPNEPARVVHTAGTLAHVLGLSLFQIADITTHNARRLFDRMTDEVISLPQVSQE